MQNARFQLMPTIDAKLCSHLMFQNSFRNIKRQNNYRNFLDDRLELWPSIPLLVPRLKLVSVAEYAGLSLNWSKTPKTDFLVTRLIWTRTLNSNPISVTKKGTKSKILNAFIF